MPDCHNKVTVTERSAEMVLMSAETETETGSWELRETETERQRTEMGRDERTTTNNSN
jgi:hypothetical protein